MSPFQEKENSFILFADIKQCLVRHFGKILLITGLFLLLGLYASLTRPVKYEIRATFKETGGNGGGSSGMMQSLLRYVGVPGASRSCHLLKSRFLLNKVIEELGLQVSTQNQSKWEINKQSIKENWKAEKKKLLGDPDMFLFRNVHYEGKKTKSYNVVFLSPTQFEIHHPQKGFTARGNVGEPLSFGEVTLTIAKTMRHLKFNTSYTISIKPSMSIFTSLVKDLVVDANMKDESIYEFSLFRRDRREGAEIIDSLMGHYQDYLRDESNRIALEQINYLEQRKNELCSKMDEFLEEHVFYLKENLGSTGFLNLNQHLQLMSGRKQNFLDKQMGIENEEKRLEESGYGNQEGDFLAIQREIQTLRKERDTMDLAVLFGKKKKKVKAFEPPYTFHDEAMLTAKEKFDQVRWNEEIIRASDQGEKEILSHFFPSLFASIHNLSEERERQQFQMEPSEGLRRSSLNELKSIRNQISNLEGWLKGAASDQELVHLIQVGPEVEREDLIAYVEHHLRLTSLQENILKERLFYPPHKQDVLQGIDLASARSLYTSYIHARDAQEDKKRQLNFSKSHLDDPDFEYISLTQVLPDGVSQDLAKAMGGLAQSMRDKRNLTDRDLERMERNLAKNRQNLERHIDQTIELADLQIQLITERISSVQSVILDLLNQEIALLSKQVEDRTLKQKKTLGIEKTLVENRLKEIEGELLMVPDKWLKEHQLQFSSEMNTSMLEGMVQLVESKNIEYNLIQVQSKPVDYAYASVLPVPPRIKTFTIIGIFIGVVLGCVFVIGYDFLRGFPVTLKNLEMQGRSVCGRFKKGNYSHLEELQDHDLKVLRDLSSSLPSNSGYVATLLTGGECCYSQPFAELLSKEGKRVLLLDLETDTKNDDGLFAFLRGDEKEVEVIKEAGVDHVVVGQKGRFLIELLRNPRFEMFLEEKKKEYDVILVNAPFKLASPEGRLFMMFSDFIALTLQTESNGMLNPYYVWEGDGNTLAFVTS